MKSVLITGASGFIGSNLINYLLTKNSKLKIYCLYNLNKPKLTKNNPKLSIIKCDLIKKNISNILPQEVDCIIHLAGIRQPYLKDTLANEQVNKNFLMTSNILEYARLYKIKNFIFISSVYIYSGSKEKKFLESIKLDPVDPLGYSKLLCESLINFYSKNYNLNAIIFRVSTAYGDNSSKTQFIPNIINKLKSTKSNIVINNLGAKRDFIFIDDVIEVLYLSLKKLKNKKKGCDVYNLSTGVSINTKDVVKKLIKIMNLDKKKFLLVCKSLKNNDFDHFMPNKKLLTNFKYRPRYLIDKGLRFFI